MTTLTPELFRKNGWEEDEYCDEINFYWRGPRSERFVTTYTVVDGGCPILTIEDGFDKCKDHTVLVLKDIIYTVEALRAVFDLLKIDFEFNVK